MTSATPETVAEQYAHLRTTVGVYTPGTPGAGLVALGGLERGEVLSRALARDSEYVEPDTARESLILDEDASVWDAVTHIELDDTSWLLAHSRDGLAGLLEKTVADAGVQDVEITDAAADHVAIAFEGPKSWRIAADLLDFEISSLVLHGATTVTLPGDSGAEGVLARIGTTGEYGYLLIAPAGSGAAEWVAARAAELDGGPAGAEALLRARTEVRHPQIPAQSAGLTVREAGLEWLVSWGREDEFRGGEALAAAEEAGRGLITVLAEAGQAPEAGSPVEAGGRAVGTVHLVAPLAGTDQEIALALLDKPFDVPGLELTGRTADGTAVTLRTAASPVVIPQSWNERLGA
ncbi:aminomethyl transferase family protein [Streptomyces huiliensis]|uniref:aminomethyl transferase family protein n=1 Tax=Streptomyces huiliensis TaxID=2876027 RepID=UPI001CBDDEA3|nr:aminomethyl transferase family protein [Streptomyces huiliensis]MBZ4319779.1 aminomethyl transferase family protein [Streptomyces huiliensis]